MPSEFDLALVEREIAGTSFAGRVMHFASVGSTNQMAVDAAQAGVLSGVWVADQQTAGRGRGDHAWHSAAGDGLYVSALVAPGLPLSAAPGLSLSAARGLSLSAARGLSLSAARGLPLSAARGLPLATGLAVQAAVRECTGLGLDLRWPNDLMFADRKCGGILVESASDAAPADCLPRREPALRYAVIGIGLNVNHGSFPPELRSVATSLYLESSRRFDREPLLAAMLRQLDEEIERMRNSLGRSEQHADLYRRFTAASNWVQGKRVKVEEDGGYTGWTRGLDPSGFLKVEDDAGHVRIVLSGGVRSA